MASPIVIAPVSSETLLAAIEMVRSACVEGTGQFPHNDADVSALVSRALHPDSQVCCLVALADGEPVGVVLGMASAGLLNRSLSIAQQVTIWVEPSHRGEGVARSLFSALAEWAKDRGCTHLAMGVTLDGVHRGSLERAYVAAGLKPVETQYARRL